MSKLEVDIIRSVTGGSIVIGPELLITDSSETRVVFSAGLTDGVGVFGPLYTGINTDNSTPGISGQMLWSNGPTMSPYWSDPEIPTAIQYGAKTIIPYVVNYNGYCSTSAYKTLPAIPSVDVNTDWVYCDGRNGTPDYRIADPNSTTGGRNWPLWSSSNVFITLEITGPTPDIRRLYQFNVVGTGSRRAFYDPAGDLNGGIAVGATTSPVVALIVSITGPTDSANRPLHTKATVILSGATGESGQGQFKNIPGNFPIGIPQDFVAGGYLKFKDATGPTFTVLNVVDINYTSFGSMVDYKNSCVYTKSLTYIMKL
jgi:hypothetical protein